jgi:uncharacterized protein involved in exopolysaccharide biosynthesis
VHRPPPKPEFDIRELLWRARRYAGLIALPIVAAVCAAYVYLSVRVPQYEAFVIASVDRPAPGSPSTEPSVSVDRLVYNVRDAATLLEIRAHGQPFLTQLHERLGLADNPELLLEASAAARSMSGVTPEEYAKRMTVARLGRNIRVTALQGNFVRIAAMDSDPKFAQKIASTVADLLLHEATLGASAEGAEASPQPDTATIEPYRERLRQSEEAVRAYEQALSGRQLRRARGAVDGPDLDEARSLIRRTDEEMETIRGRIRSARARWGTEVGTEEIPPDLSSSTTSTLERRLAGLEVSFALTSLGDRKAAASTSATGSTIGGTRQSLSREYKALAGALSDLSAGARDAAAAIALDRSILRSLRDKRQRITTLISNLGRPTQPRESTAAEQAELARLRAEVEANRQALEAMESVATSLPSPKPKGMSRLGLRLEIIEQAGLPLVPVSPNRNTVLLGAMLAGPLLSIALVLGHEKMVAVIRTVPQAEREIRARVLGTIPRVEGWARPGSFLENHWPALAIVSVLLLTAVFHVVRASL